MAKSSDKIQTEEIQFNPVFVHFKCWDKQMEKKKKIPVWRQILQDIWLFPLIYIISMTGIFFFSCSFQVFQDAYSAPC